MPKTFLKKYIPTPSRIKALKPLKLMGTWLHQPSLWIINRRSIAKAAAIGLFSAYMPIPFEMLLAGLLCWGFRAYLPLAIVLVWLSNPFTWVLLYTPPYLLGSMLLDNETLLKGEITMASLSDQFLSLWLGCSIFGLLLGAAAYILANIVWKMMIVRRWKSRHSSSSLK